METLTEFATELILLLFLIITFLQSGLDKITDWNGNVGWLKDHFKATFLGKIVPLAVGIVLVTEVVTGVLCAIGVFELFSTGDKTFGFWGAFVSCLTLLMLLFGQRLAKDYEGAKTIAVYFIPAIIALYLLG